MSYCRFNEADSDVYVIADLSGGLSCMGCRITRHGHFQCDEPGEMISHLADHILAGHKVPQRAIQRLHREVLV